MHNKFKMADFFSTMEETCTALKQLKAEDAQSLLSDVLRDDVNFSTAQRSYIAATINDRLSGMIENGNALLEENVLGSNANGKTVSALYPPRSCA